MDVVNPSMTVSRLDLGRSRLCGGWMNISSTPLGFLEYWSIYRAKRWSGRALVGCAHLGCPWTASLLYKYPNIPETLGESTKY